MKHQHKKSQLKFNILHEPNIDIPWLAFFVDRHKTSTTQHIQVFLHKKRFLVCLHFVLTYKLVLDNGEEDYLFPEYVKRLKYDNTNKIDPKTSNIFQIIMKIYFQYRRNMINRLITLKKLILDVSFISHILKYCNI